MKTLQKTLITTLLVSVAILPVHAQDSNAPKASDAAESEAASVAPKTTKVIKMAPNTPPSDTTPVQVGSLRQGNDISSESNKVSNKKWVNDDKIISRQYIQQPPMIPHAIDNYQITLKVNACLGCHNWKAAAMTGATKISLTHFKNRDGQDLSSVSGGRYFCTQCHVPQVNAEPLIENEYKPADEVDSSN